MAWSLRMRNGQRPVWLPLRSSAAFIVTMASFAVFSDIFLYAVIVPVVPFSLSSRVGVQHDNVQYWVAILLAVYGAALLIFSPVWGLLADRIQNRRTPMLIGLVLLAGSTVFLCVSLNLAMLLVGRVLQGISAALTWTVGLALVVDTVDSKHVGKALGWIGMGTSLGMLLAPLLGGLVYANGGYYSVFAMCFGLIAVDIVLRILVIEVKDAKKWIDVPQNQPTRGEDTEMGVAVTQGMSGSSENAQEEVTAATMPAANEITSTLPAAPKDAKPSIMAPMIRLLRNARVLAALWGTLVLAVLGTACDSTLPLEVKAVFGWGSTGAGLIYLPLVVPMFLSPLVGALGDKHGPKWPAAGGYLLATPFLICLRFVSENTIQHKVMLCALLTFVGVAMALVFGPVMAEITWAVEEDSANDDPATTAPYATAYGLFNMAYSGGALLGPIMGGMIRDTAGWGTVGWTLGLLSFFTGITQLIWLGGPLKIPAFLKRNRDAAP